MFSESVPRLPFAASRKPLLDAHVLNSAGSLKMNLKINASTYKGHSRKTITKTKKVGMTMEIKQLMCSAVAIIISVCTLMRSGAADPETATVWGGCGNSGNYLYTNSSAFQSNLNKFLDSLVRNVYPSGFNTSSTVVDGRQNSNSTVYGLAQCRGDLDSSDCKQCASTAEAKLVEGCRNNSGFIQLDGCFLRYDNHSFYNDMETMPIHVLYNKGNSSQPQQFERAVKVLLVNVTAKAAQSSKLFAADSVATPFNLTESIYSLAQCWRDLSRTSCGSCLTYALENISISNPGALGAQFGSQHCYLRYEIYEFFNASILSVPPAENPSVPSATKGKKTKVLGITLGAVVACSLGFMVAAVGFWSCNYVSRLKCREQIFRVEGEEPILSPTIVNPTLFFKYDTLREATSNFNANAKLGQGGFGSVFKGVLPDGRDVAVKRLYLRSTQGDAQFLNEANLISRVRHRNLVKLLGFSFESSERLLVYEYLQNSSLDKIIFGFLLPINY